MVSPESAPLSRQRHLMHPRDAKQLDLPLETSASSSSIHATPQACHSPRHDQPPKPSQFKFQPSEGLEPAYSNRATLARGLEAEQGRVVARWCSS